MKWQSAAAITISVLSYPAGPLAAQTLPSATVQPSDKSLTTAQAANLSLEAKLARLERALQQQREEIDYLKNQLLSQSRGGRSPASDVRLNYGTTGLTDYAFEPPTDAQGSQQDWLSAKTRASNPQQQRPVQTAQQDQQQPVGKPPETPERKVPEVQAIPELGGVLTPAGKLIVEPSLQYSHSQVNRFTFLGIEILDTFLIGLLEAEDTDRDLFTPALTGRLGITDRFELELKVPYVIRNDRVSFVIPQVDPNATITQELDGNGLGDIEVAAHYQINNGLNDWPIFIGNLRYKSTTGTGPFDVSRDANGLETELPTGSGFHSVEPSITALYPSDPAVFFANLGYLYTVEDDVGENFNDQNIGNVDPGDAYRVSFGMAYSINERTSFTLGYKHDFIGETDTEVNGVTLSSNTLDVGSLLLGYSFQFDENLAANFNLELGVTADAPDVLMTFRMPFLIDVF
ncbi:transporter [Denitrobaculum tricleocarpae]|uniref:Transporter n=1 Tax=Denitrobaculum tricleocarpae TaxID=2591009 RepID=A0A545TR31_9PROT|nr:transporter [Denitrobaculum tricleocarpae]TQV79680.1 transporter [Denitrobaculum tricleocarpae]